MPYTEEIKEVRCPKCGGHTWDNRATKRNPKQPDYKCRDKQCDGVIWPPRDFGNGAPRSMPQPEVKPVATSGKGPYESGPRIEAIDGPVNLDRLGTLFNLYGVCLDHVIAVEVPKLIKADIGADPETAHAIATTLFIAASKP